MPGHKTWAIGEEVIAADFNPIIADQVACVFASAAARAAAWAAPPTGALSILLDSLPNVYLFNGTAWVPITPSVWQTIATVTLAADGAISFPAIPQTFTHLQLEASLRAGSASNTDTVLVRINSDASNAYFDGDVHVFGATVGGGSGGRTGGFNMGVVEGNSGTVGRFSSHKATLHDYANTTRQKTGIESYFAAEIAQGYTGSGGFLWLSTAAITQLDLLVATTGTNNWKAGSKATLLGIR